MMEYWLWEEQSEGCDYTIGCGVRLSKIHGATNMNDAVGLAIQYYPSKYKGEDDETMVCTTGERRLKRCRILAVAETYEIDLGMLEKTRKADREKKEQMEKEAAEKVLLAQLKAKYEVE